MTSSEHTQGRYLEKRELAERFLKEQGHMFNVFPLSYAQQRLWFLDQLYPGSPLYNIPAAVQMNGPLHIRALQHSLNEIVRRHEVLRTTCTVIEGQPVQAVRPQLTLALPVTDLGLLPTSERAAEVQRRITEEAQTPFDLTRGPLLRATLLRLGEAEHVLLLTMHHIIADGWSIGVLVRELATFYEAFSTGKGGDSAWSGFPELPIQYADFAAWQQEWLAGGALEEQLTYWQRQLEGPLAVLALPTDRPRPAVQLFHGAKHLLALPVALTEALKALSQQEQSTLFMTLLAAFKVLLHRYTDQTDIIVGSPIANRRLAEVEELIGCFTNTLVLRSDLAGNPTFRALLARVRACCLNAYTYQDVPFEKLVEVLQPARDPSYAPMFQVLFALQNAPMPAFELTDLTLRLLEIDSGVAKFDLTLNLEERDDGLHGWFEYNTALFDGGRMARLAEHFHTLLAGLVTAPDTPIAHLPLLPAAERQQVLGTWNATPALPAPPTYLPARITAQAARTPEACAVVAADACLTYRELDQRATHLAHYLRTLGVGPEVRVGVGLPRSAALVVGVLGILKAGGAYVPLDLSYPPERLAFMLHDAQAPVLLTTAASGLPRAALGQTQVVDLAADWPRIAQHPATPLASAVTSDTLAYVIYTSGSTGTPKGVEIPHAGLNNLVTWHQATYQVTPADRATLLAGTAFDASVWELWPYLSAGASLYIPDELTRAVPARLLPWLRTHGITLCFLPTPLAEALLAEPDLDGLALRTLLTGGDVLHPVTRALPFALVNHYGPTEYSVVTTWAPVVTGPGADTAPPIGRPIANTQVYVLDRHGQPVPIGVPGELYISGAGLARGYLHHPALTAEHFLAAPAALAPATRLYRTGDLVRYRPDGNLEFLGRRDAQVKIRGVRMELGEIEAVLRQHPQVQETVVVVQAAGSGAPRLVAYVVPPPAAASPEPSPQPLQTLPPGDLVRALRSFLRQQLPEAMVPAAFVRLEALPLTPNGKVDRHALPPPEQMHDELETTFVAPRTPTEQALTEIWSRVLQRERVGIYHNFFDLGGHSLLATEVIAAVRDAFRVEVPLRHLFEHPTITGLAEVIEQARCSGAGPQRQTIVPLTREAHRVKLSDLMTPAETIQIEGRL